MNILIVGNGFDLSHYLPTKYDHFMDVMGAIETHEGETMSFDELFSKCREDWFIVKTKEYYLTENLSLEKDQLTEIKKLLKENSWYQYFKDHVNEVKTWIDFEQKIEQVLIVSGRCIADIANIYNSEELYKYFEDDDKNKIKIRRIDKEILDFFVFSSDEFYESEKINTLYSEKDNYQDKIGPKRTNINADYCNGRKIKNGFNSSLFLDFIQVQLEDFIKIFNLYLELIIDELKHRAKFEFFVQSNSLFEPEQNCWIQPDLIYSFNYTNTYQRIHNQVNIEYLHGSHGQQQNIVLGVSDLEDESLKKIKAYGFTKYHQKLFKETDYLFLDKYKEKVKAHKRKVDYFEKDSGNTDPTAKKLERQNIMEVESKLNINISIWGHSLDYSDRDYIIDLFSLTDEIDRNVRVTVYYFDRSAKFSLLNNILAIIGKEKVEHWMKNKWLQFKQNPEIKFQTEERAEFGEVS